MTETIGVCRKNASNRDQAGVENLVVNSVKGGRKIQQKKNRNVVIVQIGENIVYNAYFFYKYLYKSTTNNNDNDDDNNDKNNRFILVSLASPRFTSTYSNSEIWAQT